MSGPKLFWIDDDDRLTPLEEGEGRFLLFPGRELEHHLTKSLRGRIGDSYPFCRPDDRHCFSGRIVSLTPLTLDLEPDHACFRAAPSTKLGLALAPVKGDGFTSILGQATMSGIHRVRPLLTDRSVVEWGDRSRWQGKQSRFRNLVREKSQLAGRTDRMVLEDPVATDRFLNLSVNDAFLWFDENRAGTMGVSELLEKVGMLSGFPSFSGNGACLWGMVGPEGGWSQTERELSHSLESQGRLLRVSLGRLTFSAEAAALSVVSLLGLVLSSFLESRDKSHFLLPD